MKPYDYSGGGHSNIDSIFKWAAFCGTRREPTRGAAATAKRARRAAARRARRAARDACHEGHGDQRGGDR